MSAIVTKKMDNTVVRSYSSSILEVHLHPPSQIDKKQTHFSKFFLVVSGLGLSSDEQVIHLYHGLRTPSQWIEKNAGKVRKSDKTKKR